jgi:TonB family protein
MFNAANFVILLIIFSAAISAQDTDATWSGWSMHQLSLLATPAPGGKVVCTTKAREELQALRKYGDWNLVKAKSCTGWVIRNLVGVRLWSRDPPKRTAEASRRGTNNVIDQGVLGTGGYATGQGSGRGSGNGSGSGIGTGQGSDTDTPESPSIVQPLKIVTKPKASYTTSAREAQIQGTVTLRVTFLASGQIGSVSPVKGLPYGLTEQAIAAARSIRFEPARTRNGSITVTRTVVYPFILY